MSFRGGLNYRFTALLLFLYCFSIVAPLFPYEIGGFLVGGIC